MKARFTIKCDMEERWVPQFLGMLKLMQSLGNLGGSRMIKFYSDGDGDFRPKFEWNTSIDPALPEWKGDEAIFDAG
jgi:hypothetical protein